MTEAFNIDCMEYMKTLPDNAFDLAVVDPPYGDACGNGTSGDARGRLAASKNSRFEKYIVSGEAADTHTHTHTHTHSAVEQVRRQIRQVQADRSASTAATDGTSISNRIDHLHSSCRQRERERERT